MVLTYHSAQVLGVYSTPPVSVQEEGMTEVEYFSSFIN